MTMLAELYLLGIRPERIVQLSVAMMLGGALVAAANDLAFDATGYTYILLNDLFTAAQGVYLMKKLESKDLGKFGLMFYNCIFSIPFLVAVIAYRGELEGVYAFTAWDQREFVALFLLSCVMGIVLTYSIFLCTQVNSALTTTVVGCLKNILVAYMGMLLSDYIFSLTNFAGINISIAGSLLYSWRKYQISQQKSPPTLPQVGGDGMSGQVQKA